ncbi:ATP synthase subunit C lysine N-methyltransferase isoform X2 [Pangasianodon hypophthalmus]|uniref:ATP synthase subunit C lysine N-methyltransferase isoform X2 n=1 Tax=Pangasianodon hypophthalmus TaxID=310915 RepID=UPI0023079AA1|nr:ATP synthase subunit C lysine N-methyltransferase isoform X2 [Pangasianodon hypophthalmus]
MIMEDSVDVILQEKTLHHAQERPLVMAASGAMLMASYALWTVFALPGFRKVPTSLKVPYLPSSGVQTQNVMRLLQGRRGCLADLGSGDGRLGPWFSPGRVSSGFSDFFPPPENMPVFAVSSLGFQCTGFEINSILIGYARARARWMGIPTASARFVNEDFWKMEVLGRKLEQELAHDARVIACRFPFPHWHASASEGQGLDKAWAYDMATVRRLLT